jgi:hypothetical protein
VGVAILTALAFGAMISGLHQLNDLVATFSPT